MDEKMGVFSLRSSVYHDVFLSCCECQSGFIAELFELKEEVSLAYSIQETSMLDLFKFRAQRRSLRVARYLISDSGHLDVKRLVYICEALKNQGYIPSFQGYSDASLNEHMQYVLKKFESSKTCQNLLKKFTAPLCHRWAEKIIKDTLGYPENHILTDRDIKIAVLSSCLYPLRQNVGSCFATAPAILIQKEQLENLLTDLLDLLMTGKMIRTFAGKEHSVPLSPSAGLGELRRSVQHLLHLGDIDMPPAIFLPLVHAGILDEGMDKRKRKEWFFQEMKCFCEEKTQLSVEEFFQYVILKDLQITDEEMQSFKLQEKITLRHLKKVELIERAVTSVRKEKFEKAISSIEKARKTFLFLSENALLRAWEYTIASLAEAKMDFSRWNLYSSLGLQHEEHAGIGQVIYRHIENRISDCNDQLEQYQRDYEIAVDQLRASEALLKRASSEEEARRLKVEFQTRSHHAQSVLELRDRFYKKASFYPQLFSFILEKLDHMFPEFFQEIYDAQMQEIETYEYEDSPAGFRLVFKHGRRDASLWEMIQNQEDFIDALTSFFSFVEPELGTACDEKGCGDDIKEIISKIILHIRTEEFIKSAYARSVKGHEKATSQKSSKFHKKPWCYTSGGVMSTLLKTYYRRESEFSEESFSVESSLDLLTLILETMKGLNYNFTVYFPIDTPKRILMYSPTHAFQLLPYENEFFQSWDYSGFTYTWVRDKIIAPRQGFYRSLTLSMPEQRVLLEKFSSYLPTSIAHHLKKSIHFENIATIKEFSSTLLEHLPPSDSLNDALDSFLYQSLPLIPGYKWKEVVSMLLEDKLEGDLPAFLDQLERETPEYLTAREMKEISKAVYILLKKNVCLDFDLHKYISDTAAKKMLSSPNPLIFADSNWSQNLFGFVVSPTTEEIKFWRVSETGQEGVFMRPWANYLSPSNNKPWGVYVKPQEYSALFERKI